MVIKTFEMAKKYGELLVGFATLHSPYIKHIYNIYFLAMLA